MTPFHNKSIKPCFDLTPALSKGEGEGKAASFPALSPSAFGEGLGVRFTACSKVATLLRLIPKMLKKSSQKDLASASSLTSSFHSRVKAMALLLISFQLNGI